MLTFPQIDPVAFSIGPLRVHWYGLMYLVAFGLAWWLGRWRAKQAGSGWNNDQVSDLVFYGALGAVLGGRIGYTLFYGWKWLADDPLYLFRVWEGGMSFHGGFLGVVLAMWIYARRTQRTFWFVTDFIAPLVPLGLGAGRIGNFINGELRGRVTDAPWAIVFPGGGDYARHPSQLYQATLEGLLLFLVLWWYSRRPRPAGAVSALFLVGYGAFRFVVEFAREPDAHLGFIVLDWLTMGQVLSLPMLVFGVGLFAFAYRKQRTVAAVAER
ncbi:MAG: prolipoprotein diacylglyceryl transferase [Proteobacteria bacterium]|nr:MAG: prolipoprotein diacylglyceryl transferase [Pseudomonadota bacterium]QKK10685.1 MAG: prolipoprotein diacylglyceryl transferase [Pseudomonadota bacterium]